MGLMKKSKLESIRGDAARALQDGRSVFVARYGDEVFTFQGTGSVSGVSATISPVVVDELIGDLVSQ